MKPRLTLVLALALGAVGPAATPQAQQATDTAALGVTLLPTNHPRLPRELSQLWMAPVKSGARSAPLDELVSAVKLEVAGNYAKALPILSQPALQQSPVGEYAQYYAGLAELRLDHPDLARRIFQSV